jgi:peptidyl-prolyl cis-trans isomerase SurA
MQEMQDVPILSTESDRSFTMRSFRQVSLPVALILTAGFLPMTGCNRGHSADVVATVNGRAIMRTDLDKGYQAQLGEAPQVECVARTDRLRDRRATRRQDESGRDQ